MNMKRVDYQKELAAARAAGWEAGHHAGMEDQRRKTEAELTYRKLDATVRLMQASSSYQEGVTKLLMSANKDL